MSGSAHIHIQLQLLYLLTSTSPKQNIHLRLRSRSYSQTLYRLVVIMQSYYSPFALIIALVCFQNAVKAVPQGQRK